jgi:hypothetical protein
MFPRNVNKESNNEKKKIHGPRVTVKIVLNIPPVFHPMNII